MSTSILSPSAGEMRRRLFRCLLIALSFLLRPAWADVVTIPESKLLDPEFSVTAWGGSVVRTDAAGDAVHFSFSGLSSSSTGIKDDYPIDTVYGQNLPSHANGDFSNFDGYKLVISNLDAEPVAVSIFINTGFTGVSGVPSNDPTNDTFWQSPWSDLAPGGSEILFLDFDNAIPAGIEDNKFPHTQGTNGIATAINAWDRGEVSALGFQISSDGNSEATISVRAYPEPGTSVLAVMAAMMGVIAVLRKSGRVRSGGLV